MNYALKEFSCFLGLSLVGILALVGTLSSVTDYLRYNTMQKLGYEAKYVNFNCYAKQQDKWLDCSEVTKNTRNVNVKEVK